MSNNLYGQMFKQKIKPRLADASLTLVTKLYDFGDLGCRERDVVSYGPGGRFVAVVGAVDFVSYCYDGETGLMIATGQATRYREVKTNSPVLTGVDDAAVTVLNKGCFPMRAADVGSAPSLLYVNPDSNATYPHTKLVDGQLPMTFNGALLTGKLPSPWAFDDGSVMAPLPVGSSVANRPGLIWIGGVSDTTTTGGSKVTRLAALCDETDFGLAMGSTPTFIIKTGTTPFEGFFEAYGIKVVNALNGNTKRGLAIVYVEGTYYGVCFTVGVGNFTPLALGSLSNNFSPFIHLVGAMATGTNDFVVVGWIDSNAKGQIYLGKSSEFASGKLTTTNNKTATSYSRSLAGSGHFQGSSKVMHAVGFMQDKGKPQVSPQIVNLWFDNGSASGAWLACNIPSTTVFNADVWLVAVGLVNTTSSTYQRRIIAVQRTRISDGAKFIEIWTRGASGSFVALNKYIPWPETAWGGDTAANREGQIAQIRARVVNTTVIQCDLILWNGVYRFTL